MKKILIYDDEGQIAKDLKEKLKALPVVEKDYEIIALHQEEFEKSMAALKERRSQVRSRGEWPDSSETDLDEAAIFIIDYDLFNTNPFLTGEDVAYSARCFSKCGLIVALNQYYEVDFDLTLKGHIESFADLNINTGQLGNPNLWGGDGPEFYPWYWSVLPKFQQTFEQRVNDARSNLNDKPICEVLGFELERFDFLPRSISQFIGAEPKKTTFREFVQKSGSGMHHSDSEKANDDILARVGAARISKWLERMIMPELDIVVDGPHLISRYPSLLGDKKEEIQTWNKTASRMDYAELGLKIETIKDAQIGKDFWFSRPVWFWDKVHVNSEILEVREPWETFRPDWVFCEDTSKFHSKDECKEFVAKVESPFARRFVKEVDDIKYQPRVRFSL
ncbi:MAG: hypothetical protein FOGNACKC_00758 [Anaerolineae bacterium]|nr:hypothetical protein [Anaerolineae bacterium]